MNAHRILIIDDDQSVCDLVRSAFELEGFAVDEAHHALEAERALTGELPDAILLDIGLPGFDGLFYTRRLREDPRTRGIPIVATCGSENAARHATSAGADAFIRKPFDVLELLSLLETVVGVLPFGNAFGVAVSDEVAHERAERLARLIESSSRRNARLEDAYRRTLEGIAASLESRGLETTAHTERVTAYAMRLTLETAPALTDDPSLEWGFLLHDIGNIGIPDRILLKRGSLNAEDWQLLKTHTTIGERLLEHVPLLAGEGLSVVRSHHERWDGTGYPDRLTGPEIPLGARIFAVADALDAMTDRRPYRRPLRWDSALSRLRNDAGGQFDADVVASVAACEPDLVAIRDAFAAPLDVPGHDEAPRRALRRRVGRSSPPFG